MQDDEKSSISPRSARSFTALPLDRRFSPTSTNGSIENERKAQTPQGRYNYSRQSSANQTPTRIRNEMNGVRRGSLDMLAS